MIKQSAQQQHRFNKGWKVRNLQWVTSFQSRQLWATNSKAYQFHIHHSGNLGENLAAGSGTCRRTATIMGNDVQSFQATRNGSFRIIHQTCLSRTSNHSQDPRLSLQSFLEPFSFARHHHSRALGGLTDITRYNKFQKGRGEPRDQRSHASPGELSPSFQLIKGWQFSREKERGEQKKQRGCWFCFFWFRQRKQREEL